MKIAILSACVGLALPAAAAFAQPQEAPQPRNTPGLPSQLAAIDDVLTGGLLNDPTTLAWDGYGSDMTREMVTDESYPGGGAALRIVQGTAGPVYDSGINIPILAPIEEGERVTIGFFARAIDTDAPAGTAMVGVRFQQNREPYPGFGDRTVTIGPDWNFYEVSAVADRDIRRDAIVALQFGLQRQTLEIGQAIVVSGVSTIVN
ncbi:hypothetical protein [Aurantiacibacter spongiae]|uniref:CBM-cenC domain-containing protein n=1 Tax=Aurantiacibacter spongiae TaxID=2488860 RepID=A0A3N5CUL5_9SPHN|nr:hypothetical protein [Aurantiacibacter spongiae]RPF71130.1 hypothetical protein EG799_05520 [Aurantiacibacter spongiae]